MSTIVSCYYHKIVSDITTCVSLLEVYYQPYYILLENSKQIMYK